MPYLPLDLLASGAHELGVELSQAQLEQFDDFAVFLVETNRTLNLTRITEPEAIVTSHYLDSLTCLRALKVRAGASVIDIGTGAGLPGIPIAIVRPDVRVTLLDSSGKKLKFLAEAAGRIGLENVETLAARAEGAGRDPAHRERYDVGFARALADMKILAELCLPLVRVGGHLVAQKSAAADEEIAAARPLIGQLGGAIEQIARVPIPHTDIERLLVVISKGKPTPAQFPRPYSRIAQGKK